MIRKIKFFLISVFIISNINALPSKAKKQVEPQNVKIELPGLELLDYPSDRGDSLILKWDTNNDKELIYEIMVSTDEKNWKKVKEQKEGSFTSQNIDLPFWIWNKKENKNASVIEIMKVFNIQEEEFFKEYSNGFKLYAKLNVISQKQKSESQTVSAIAIGNWFRADRLNSLIIVLLVSLVFFMVVSHAKKRELFIRRIAGLDAIDEAVGRATEMGKPVIYVPGIGSMSNISTIASVFILGEVGKKIAQYDANIKVPHYDPIVFTVAKETIKQAYIEAERPDSYRDDINMFITQDQFAYAAAVDGMITREKPAACFYMGYFMAESLLLAEVGASAGAIQIAGTDIDHQLPFFVTACDYTLIGEELYAAGAYLSKEPMLVSALKVQDFGKLFFIIFAALLSIVLVISSKAGAINITNTILDILKVR
ncbi:MAG: DUF6754 domain-containing protein [Elusimicrobiales bacterium]|nr:hypothetical protein [Elusimicrobiales bacterium]HOL62415.1 hypothetical protein [Elusimicrobiales bacterium]HPO94393.1 hypothetical protein [Elusimicrobiales bacterium]